MPIKKYGENNLSKKYKMNEKEIFKELCENDFSFYVEQFLKVIEPETKFEWNWHMNVLCHYCEQVYYGHIRNLDINIPPRMLKSLIVSVLFPTWVWTKDPSHKFITVSATHSLSSLFNMKRREIVESEEYQTLWPTGIKEDMNRIDRFENEFNGFMLSTSVGGSLIGTGGHTIITDDLLEVKDAFSKARREYVNQWYSSALYNRVQDKRTARRININQRLHAKDLSNHLKENYDFKALVLPMVKGEKDLSTVDFKDPRKVGEYLHPARYSDKEKNDEYKGLGLYGWASQMQQNPLIEGGGIIKNEWIRRWSVLPKEFDQLIITADLSFKGNKDSDYVCFQAWGKKDRIKYMIDIVRGQWSYAQTKSNFKTFCEKHPGASLKYIEDKANGPALISDMGLEINGLIGWPEDKALAKLDKVQRLHLCSSDYENGLVLLPPDIALVDEYILELTSFTEKGSTTGNDDMVDTSTIAIIQLNEPTYFADA